MTLATRPLGDTGLRVTVLGLGTAPLGGLMSDVDDTAATEALRAGWEGGIRFVDTAPFYGFGRAERRTGDVLRTHPRETYVLSTKVGRRLAPDPSPPGAENNWVAPLPFRPVYDYSYDGVRRGFEDSLQRLGLDRVDILLLHDIGEFTHGAGFEHHVEVAMTGGLRALQALKAEGLIKAYGIGVNETAVLMTALERGEWDCFLLAGRYTLLEQASLDDLMPACAARGVSVIVGGPYNSGLLAGGDTWNYAKAPPELIARRDRLRQVCADHGVAIEAAALQFPLAHPAVASVIPGPRTAAEAQANLAHLESPIPSSLWQALKDEGLIRLDAPVPG